MTDPKVKALLQRVKTERALRRQHDEAYYHDDKLDGLLQRPLEKIHLNGSGNANETGLNGAH